MTDTDDREVLEYNGATGALQNWYAYGLGANDVLNQMNVASSTRETMIPDVQGSIVGTLDAASGTLATAGYQTFGENTTTTTGTFRYTGQRFDPETAGSTAQPSGLYYYRARMYSAGWGRFMQPDSIGYQNGMNLYAYVGNDPTNFTDPNGQCPWCIVGAVVGGGVTLGVQIYRGTDPYHAYLNGGWSDAGKSVAEIGVAAAGGAATGGIGTLVEAAGAGTAATIGTTAFFGASTSADVYAINNCAIEQKCSGAGLGIAMETGALDVGAGGPLGELAGNTAQKLGANAGQQFAVNATTQATVSGLVSGVGPEAANYELGNYSNSSAANGGIGTLPSASSSSLGDVNWGNTSIATPALSLK